MVHGKVHGGFGFRDRNEGGATLLVVANSSFSKEKEHFVTFCNTVAKTQNDFLLLRKVDKSLCKDSKVILSENSRQT